MELTSTAFVPLGEIPRRHTCDGQDSAPPLRWTGIPEAAKSLVLIMDDPDAPDPASPQRTWVHWVMVDIAPASAGFAGGGHALPAGAREGLNDWDRIGYGGPCPPVGRHRYVFKLYALDKTLPDLYRPTKAAIEQAMSGHVLAQAQLIGTYQRLRG